jgi:pimeloyl-ACP methyl ester carboxylesterase
MEKMISKDGTLIAYERSGSGPPLVLLHGAGFDYKYWDVSGVRSALAEQTTVYALNRRGRGESGDAERFNLEREAEDVAALIDLIDEPVTLLGHSYGALIALEAAPHLDHLLGLILYEPFTLEEGLPYLKQGLVEIQELLNEGKKEEALILDSAAMGFPETALEEYRSFQGWPAVVDAADTMIRDYEILIEYQFEDNRYKNVTTPTLLLSGGEEPQPLIAATETMNKVFPNSRIHVFEGQGHFAMNSATDEFINVVLDFIAELG